MSKQAAKLTSEKIKGLKYSKEGKINPETGQMSYPKDILWDTEMKGFGVRVFPTTGTKSYIYKYRTSKNESKYLTIGSTGEISLKDAKDKAVKEAAKVIDGGDPAKERHDNRHGKLVSDLCEQFTAEHIKEHSPKRQRNVKDRMRKYILPALGTMQVQHVTKDDIMGLRKQIGIKQEHPYLANAIRRQLSTMFDRAKEWGYVGPDFVNPALAKTPRYQSGIEDFDEKSRDAYVKPEHMGILARAIEAEPNVSAKLAIWMYIFTGKRKMEILSAEWKNIDETAQTLYIPDTKSGVPEQLPLSDEAWAIIQRCKSNRKVGNGYIFPGKNANEHLVNIRKPWERIKAEAVANGAESVAKVVVHGLRHTMAVWLLNHSDADLALVGKVLNHKSSSATEQYAKYKITAKARALQNIGTLVKHHSEKKSAEVIELADAK
jgi:integrase